MENKDWENESLEGQSWIDDLGGFGKFLEIPMDTWVEARFKDDNPQMRATEYYGKLVKEYTWKVTNAEGEEKLLSRSAITLLNQLADISRKHGGLANRRVRIMLVAEGGKKRYKVEDLGL
jgi:hypothetical protein